MQSLPFVTRPQGLQVSKPFLVVLCFVSGQAVLFLLAKKQALSSWVKPFQDWTGRDVSAINTALFQHVHSYLAPY